MQTIKVNWNNEQSIKEAENQKLQLEDRGFKLVNTVSSLDSATLFYNRGY